jgi:hypothetical protein
LPLSIISSLKRSIKLHIYHSDDSFSCRNATCNYLETVSMETLGELQKTQTNKQTNTLSFNN